MNTGEKDSRPFLSRLLETCLEADEDESEGPDGLSWKQILPIALILISIVTIIAFTIGSCSH